MQETFLGWWDVKPYSVYCIFSECTMSSQRKFTFAISSPDEFLVKFCGTLITFVSNNSN